MPVNSHLVYIQKHLSLTSIVLNIRWAFTGRLMVTVLYSLCGSFTKVDVDSFKASLFLCYIHSNCKFYTIDGIHKIWEWNNIITCPLFNRTRVKWLAFTQPQSRILGQDWVLKSVNSVLSPAFRTRFHGSFQICVSRCVFVYKYKGSVDAQFYKAGLR